MGQEKIGMPATPEGWAIRLSKIVKVFHEAHGLDRFPIDVASIACDYSKNVFPDEPITLIEGRPLSKNFEGALIPNPNSPGEWGIFYNSSIRSTGRQNFTLGHELGHYLMHRHLSGKPIFCAKRDMWTWNSAYGQMEFEANKFASYLLMPLDDFREQTVSFNLPTVGTFEAISRRYDASLTAAILKWLEITTKRAMIVVSVDGFIDWARSSEPLLKSGVFFKAKQVTIPLPADSLARRAAGNQEAASGDMLSSGVWAEHEEVYESVMFSEYHGMAISLLIYPDHSPKRWGSSSFDSDELNSLDTFTRFHRN